MNIDKIKEDFPIFKNNPTLVYLDSAATSQRPQQVIDAVNEFYTNYNANVHRGIYKISEEASEKFENVRTKVRDFISAKSEQEIIFTKNTTESINLVMRGWGEKNIKKGDKIVISIMEHHSNFVPWQQLAKQKGAKLEIIDINEEGELKESDFEKIKGAKLLAITHVSNVLGTLNNVNKLCKLAHDAGAKVLVDGAQSIPHMQIDASAIDCDFFAFSGHKMLGPTGVGILYGKEQVLEETDPFLYGGDMISEVHVEESKWNELPFKFESGTPPASSVIGLGAAIDYLGKLGMENIRKHEQIITQYALQKMTEINGVNIFGPKNPEKRAGVIAFTVNGVHPHDLASILDEYNVAIRSGHHCAMPLHERLALPASSRASFYIYNDKKDVDKLCDGIKEAKKIFKVD
ncbi:cysteine desulfurase [Candidatus Micrarchaeota archaeon]|nr:cysteine desulfurase [Candidatus Micrarchaeota archaeon]